MTLKQFIKEHRAELDACIAPSAVVITQGCDALTSQSVGYYGKWLMLEQFLVAVLLSATSNHQQRTL